jgi:uncharacterized membrane protein YhaH (DUF805 family)
MQQSLGEGWAVAAILIALPTLFFLVFKIMTAKTRKAHFAYFAATTIITLVLFGFLTETGVMPSAENFPQRRTDVPATKDVLSQLPTGFLVTVAIVGMIWFGGINWILIRQARKAGRPWWDPFIPFTPPFRDMDQRSWLQVFLLVFLGFAVFSVGLNFLQQVP